MHTANTVGCESKTPISSFLCYLVAWYNVRLGVAVNRHIPCWQCFFIRLPFLCRSVVRSHSCSAIYGHLSCAVFTQTFPSRLHIRSFAFSAFRSVRSTHFVSSLFRAHIHICCYDEPFAHISRERESARSGENSSSSGGGVVVVVVRLIDSCYAVSPVVHVGVCSCGIFNARFR